MKVRINTVFKIIVSILLINTQGRILNLLKTKINPSEINKSKKTVLWIHFGGIWFEM